MDARISSAALDWDEAETRLVAVSAWIRPAELHGLLCGSACAGGALDDQAWLGRLLEHAGEDLAGQADEAALIWFRNRALVNLGDADLRFDLLLPDEEAALAARLDALAAWCSGFLSGFGLAGGRSDHLDEDGESGLGDLAAIADLDPDTEESDAEDNYAELVEYVRVVVLLLLQQRVAVEQEGAS